MIQLRLRVSKTEIIDEPRDKETYIVLDKFNRMYVCDYGYTYNFFGKKSKKKKWTNRFSKFPFEITDIVAVVSAYDIHGILQRNVNKNENN